MAALLCEAGAPEWLELRRTGITATDITVIMGLVGWDSPWALWHRKRGLIPPTEPTDRMRLGSWLEGAVAEEWGTRDGWLHKWAEPSGLWVSEDRPWQMATPDKVLCQPCDGNPPALAVLECKTWDSQDARAWEDGPPPKVRAQVLWQMDVLGVARGHVAVVFLPSGEFRSYTTEHRHDAWLGGDNRGPACPFVQGSCAACNDIALMRERGLEFWRLLEAGTPPPLDGSPVTTDALRFLHSGAVKGKQAEIAWLLWRDYRMACKWADEAAQAKRAVENRIRAALGDATEAVGPDGEVFARRQVFKRAGYAVGPSEVDRLVRVKEKGSE